VCAGKQGSDGTEAPEVASERASVDGGVGPAGVGDAPQQRGEEDGMAEFASVDGGVGLAGVGDAPQEPGEEDGTAGFGGGSQSESERGRGLSGVEASTAADCAVPSGETLPLTDCAGRSKTILQCEYQDNHRR